MATIDTIGRLLQPLFEPLIAFFDPAKRVFWPFLLASFGVAALLSRGQGRGLFNPKLWTHPSALFDYRILFANAVVRAVLITPWALSAFGLSVWLVADLNRHFGPMSPPSLSSSQVTMVYTLTLFVAWDLSRYVLHRLLHTIPFLWQFHQVHHSAEVLTPLTLYRTHPVESILYAARGVVVVGAVTGVFFYAFGAAAVQHELLGVNALGFVFNLAGANLRHSPVWLSYGDRLEHIFISPAQHQIHHSQDRAHFDRNYGSWLAIWDWMGRSLYVAGAKKQLTFGLGQEELNHDPRNVSSAYKAPFMSALGTSSLGRKR